jgi:sterol 3beta-glucosyltransferase
MNITILTTGSRGDVQPFVALGTGLKQAGYQVTVCTHEHFASSSAARGLQYAFMNDELIRLAQTEEGRAAFESGGNPLGLLKKVMPAVRKTLSESWAAAQGAQAIVYHPKALAGSHIVEKLNIPGFLSVPVPLCTPTSAFPLPLLPDLKLGGCAITPVIAIDSQFRTRHHLLSCGAFYLLIYWKETEPACLALPACRGGSPTDTAPRTSR